jgi:hypothetical protein
MLKMKCKYSLEYHKNIKCDKKGIYEINNVVLCSKHAESIKPFALFKKDV